MTGLLPAYTVLVWIRLALAPWWIQWPVYAALIFTAAGIPVGVINRNEPGQWPGWWIGIAVAALLVGLVWSLAARSRAPQLRQLLDGLTPAQYPQAAKAVLAGPIPTDPAIRHAAARLAERQRTSMSPKLRKTLMWIMVADALIQLSTSAFGSKITFTTLSSATIFAAMAVFWWLYPPLLEARARLLAGSAHAPNYGTVQP
ncbi:hypothetical protein CCUG63695_02410 [Mycobacteroides franklinii]|uniref:Uncharacterized protein n=1 Tax=Mycobacteroides franklinii TaxID=948102 RepID=A0A4R8R8R6_9MYCO|nr:hypothetical protein CCUG64054_02483 [Mycobacteroides franklinii]TDZ52584.1 hypothetical protein CCUG63697_01068 [Mycobacteroides franklinii]TDZ55991.1 hypothetical protein CCUG63696_02485 [Mycobacteroides franklinii]TDZ62932.1 hypothetical protein CCUG63695_02410 [Mycobacteroides franklinii]TDZ69329.1 hypothetical protein CCUG64056_02483 [Mycobacteroides franklinii]